MQHTEGIDRDRLTMFPEVLDEYIHPDNPVRSNRRSGGYSHIGVRYIVISKQS